MTYAIDTTKRKFHRLLDALINPPKQQCLHYNTTSDLRISSQEAPDDPSSFSLRAKTCTARAANFYVFAYTSPKGHAWE